MAHSSSSGRISSQYARIFSTVRVLRYRAGANATPESAAAAPPPELEHSAGSDTGKAAGLAGAMIVNNVLALISSVVFARLLDDYGALAALISYLVILTVVGQAVQVATAREGVLGHLGTGEELLATLERWARGAGGVHGAGDGRLDPAAAADRRRRRRPASGMGGGRRHPRRLPLPRALHPARCATGNRRLPHRRPEPDRRAGRAAVAGAILAAVGLGIGGAYLGSLISYIAMSRVLRRS